MATTHSRSLCYLVALGTEEYFPICRFDRQVVPPDQNNLYEVVGRSHHEVTVVQTTCQSTCSLHMFASLPWINQASSCAFCVLGPRGTPPDPFLVDTMAACKSKSQLRLRRVAKGWSLCSAPGQGEIQGFKAFRYLTMHAFACVGFGLTICVTKYRRCIPLELTACSCS